MAQFVIEHPDLEATYLMMMDNLSRLGLVRSTIDYDLQKVFARGEVVLPAAVGAPQYRDARMTALGDAFVIACNRPGIAERERYMFHA
jgi:hypothetical protein